MRQASASEQQTVEKLELSADAVATTSTIEVGPGQAATAPKGVGRGCWLGASGVPVGCWWGAGGGSVRGCWPPRVRRHSPWALGTAVQVSWKAPSKNSERISSFKVMAATSTGVVKEVYSGRDTAARATGLRPNAEYVFCVKATYDDNTFLWSESRAFRTKA